MMRAAYVSVVVTLLMLRGLDSAVACLCVMDPLRTRVDESQMVFVAKLLSVKQLVPVVDPKFGLVRVKVLESWKGIQVGREIDIATPTGAADDCGYYEFERGALEGDSLHLVFVRPMLQKGSILTTDRCIGSQRLRWAGAQRESLNAWFREFRGPTDTLEVRVVCSDGIALKLLDPDRRSAFSARDSGGRDSSGTEIPGCELIRPYENGNWEHGVDDSAASEPPDTTAATAGNRGFRVRAPKFGAWRLEASLPSILGIISADVWLNVRVKPRGSALSDVDSAKSWVELRPGQRATCTLTLGRDGSLVRTRTRVSQIVAEPPRHGR